MKHKAKIVIISIVLVIIVLLFIFTLISSKTSIKEEIIGIIYRY